MEQGIVGQAEVAHSDLAERGVLPLRDGKTDIAEHSERKEIAARTDGVQVHRIGISAAASGGRSALRCGGRGRRGGTGERGLPVDGNRNLSKGASEFNHMFRILVGIID